MGEVDLRGAMELRRMWLYETQLRRLNTSSFREVTTDSPGPMLDLLSEERIEPAPIGSQTKSLGRVHLDGDKPVWTPEELARHGTFTKGFLGVIGDWLDYAHPARLIERLAELQRDYEKSRFASETDLSSLQGFARTPGTHDGMGRAIARAELAAVKPWLIPELYKAEDRDTKDPAVWVESLERFVTDHENERKLLAGMTPRLIEITFDEEAFKASFVGKILPRETAEDMFLSFHYRPALRTDGFAMRPVGEFPFSDNVKYWMRVVHDPLREVVALKPNSDMGLCQVVRLLYRYGPLPASLGTDEQLTWRTRTAPDERFTAFFARQAELVKGNPGLLGRLQSAWAKFETILETSRSDPRSAAPTFSPLAFEIIKHGLKSYKFWLDEPLRAKGNIRLNGMKNGLGITDANNIEMEFWSENHYIMFASSEYLLGQLWADDDDFQPGRLFLKPGDKIGVKTGTERMERGRARVLKWLNNRLQFGWMEFNSSGYYREHLWALVNLVDFALDDEVRTKAQMAVDLLLFDVVRFLHKGTMGAPGGRSQFKSRNCGWDNALNDVVEVMLGAQGLFSDGDSQIGCSFASSTYVVPDVLLEIGAAPPKEGFTDRSRVSITFDEAPKYGFSLSQKSDARDSLFEGYQPKRDRYSPFIDNINREIARTHTGYGAVEDDTVFFWGMSAFFNKQIVRNSLATADKFGLDESPAFVPALRLLIEVILPLVRRGEHGLIGGAIGAVGAALGGVPAMTVVGAVAGLLESDVLGEDLEAGAADDLSLFTEGSTRTRANILTYRNADVMLSSLQNFRTGQLNFQSTTNQVSLNTSVNVFTTAGFAGMDISNVHAALGGALAGAAIGMPVIGAVAGVIVNEAVIQDAEIGDDGDGPSWWTGSWALPMVAQSGSAAIMVYDFHDIQGFLADVGSHAWFPTAGFEQYVERRTSAYDNADFPLLDITDIGPKGFWLFGRVVHPAKKDSGEEPGEGYVGVFSNQRPEWLDKEFDLHERRLEAASEEPIEDKRDAIDDKLDELEDKDNVGYGGRQVIETVVKRSVNGRYRRGIGRDEWLNAVRADLDPITAPVISKHRKEIDELAGMYIDLADLERIWREPFPDFFAGRDWYAEGKNIWILQVGSKAEFGSFEAFMDRVSAARVHIDDTGDMECSYDIPKPGGGHDRLSVAYGDGGRFGLNGHGFETDLYPRFESPFVRGGRVEWGQREYLIEWNEKTLLHDFDDFERPIRTEAPKAGEDDAETVRGLVIYLRTGDEEMEEFTVATATVDIGCERVTADQVVAAGPVDEDARHDAEWIFFDRPAKRSTDMNLTLRHTGSKDDSPEWKASFSVKALMGDRRLKDCALSIDAVHFEDSRRTIGPLPFSVTLSAWTVWEPLPDGKKPLFWTIEADKLILLDNDRRLWHRRIACGSAWEAIDNRGDAPDWTLPFSLTASGHGIHVVAAGTLVAWSGGGWERIESPVALDTVNGGYATGVDGDIYARNETGDWRTFGVDGFTLAVGVPVQVAGDTLLALGDDGMVWARPLDALEFLLGERWRPLSPPGVRLSHFAAAHAEGVLRIAARDRNGGVWIHSPADPMWTYVGGPAASPETDLHWVTPFPGRWWLIGCGADGLVRGVQRTDGDTSPAMWTDIGKPGTRPVTRPRGGISVACRARGQIEVFAETLDGTLTRTWWS